MLLIDRLDDAKLIDTLMNGGVGVLPSDTVYGLVCRAADEKAVKRLYRLKSRERKPGTVIAANVEQLIELDVPARYLKPVAYFWPNPISIELPYSAHEFLNQGTGKMAFRVVKDQTVRGLLEKTGPLLTSSANQPGEPPATNLAEAKAYFGDDVDFYVEGGDLSDRPASTIIKIVDDEVVVLREGAIKINDKGEIV